MISFEMSELFFLC